MEQVRKGGGGGLVAVSQCNQLTLQSWLFSAGLSQRGPPGSWSQGEDRPWVHGPCSYSGETPAARAGWRGVLVGGWAAACEGTPIPVTPSSEPWLSNLSQWASVSQAPLPEFLNQRLWPGDQDLAFLTSDVLVWGGPHLDYHSMRTAVH